MNLRLPINCNFFLPSTFLPSTLDIVPSTPLDPRPSIKTQTRREDEQRRQQYRTIVFNK